MSQKPTSDAKNAYIRSYGRRWSKGLRPTRASALEDVLPQAAITLPEGDALVTPHVFFNRTVRAVWFEIGFGNGEHLLEQAAANPDVGLIGCEPFMNGVAAICVGMREMKTQNTRLWPDDARVLMDRLAPQSLDRLFLLHPDPWPKTRHHKRRFIQTETLDEIARVLKSGGEFRMATDHADLAAWMMDKTFHHPAFAWEAKSAADWRNPPADWPKTRYGQKGLKQGRPPVYLIFRRA
ncbi:MAG: tRNA (guanosine(46)-N7)-methyltransferase TrmB [Alphaproteobacteria bacterium]|nr:tRNA (guanosine(46)-N7)-methyltransferase TrmB [Alphaproteobacteria bacterium]MDE2336601.1 tRNA (guanosine(46)-N7)-methyltransferase TrmB [Alphaproteobacteria bacterium]